MIASKPDEKNDSDYSEYGEPEEYVSGPPFNPKEYMISPSDSEVVSVKESPAATKRKLRPIDLKFEQSSLDARNALKKLQNIIRDKFGRDSVKRHRSLVRMFVKGMPNGFLMEDISPVIEVMEFFISNYATTPEYVNMINMILKVAANPPRMMKSSDVLHCKSDLSRYFTMLGELLATFDDSSIQLQVLCILNSLLVRSTPADISCVKLHSCHAAMEDSLLPYTIACILETVSDALYLKYLEIALQIALVSKKACVVMVQNGAIEFILWRLDPNQARGRELVAFETPNSDAKTNKDEVESNDCYTLLDMSGQVLWTLLNAATDFNVECHAPPQRALWSLRYALHAETKKRTTKAKATRNNLAGIILKLIIVFHENLPLVQSGLAVDVVMLAVASEIGTKNTWAENVKFGACQRDYSLKKMMIMSCLEISRDVNSREVLKEQKFIEGILHMINPGLTSLSVEWSPSQFFHLILIGLTVLSEIVPLLPEVYVTNKGNTRLLMALEWFKEAHFNKMPLLETLKALSHIVTCERNALIIQDLKEQYGTLRILQIGFYLLRSERLSTDVQNKLMRIFIILEMLCKNDKKLPASLGEKSVKFSILFLNRAVMTKEDDNHLDPKMLICFCGYLWEAVVWFSNLLELFTEEKGIYLVLDLIEKSPYPVQIIFLGLIVDMADEGETLTHLLTWRDKDGFGILNTMIKIWKKEELIYNVPRLENGCISDAERPLMSDEQWYLTSCVKNAHTCSPAIAEMMCNARPKIHSLYQLFRHRYRDVTEMNESLYSVSFSAVQTQHQVYIPVIENFMNLKLGEIWYELYNDIMTSGLVPSTFDGATLSSLLEQKHREAYRIKTMQEEIITMQKLNDAEKEKDLYGLIKSCRLAPSLDALLELDYITRTSYKDVQIAKKSDQLQEIQSSLNLPLEIDDTHIHRTGVRNTNVTYLCGKYVWFKSEREVVPESSLVQPVSPNTSSCNDVDDGHTQLIAG